MGKICDFRKTFHCVKTQIRQKKRKQRKKTQTVPLASPLYATHKKQRRKMFHKRKSSLNSWNPFSLEDL